MLNGDGSSMAHMEAGRVPALIQRKSMMLGMAGALGLGVTYVTRTPAAAASNDPWGVSVKDTGAIGDGVTDDTAAVRAALVQANGAQVFFPAGTYVLDNLIVDRVARFQLDPAATLLAKPNSPSGWMITLRSTEFRIRGGTIDGNKANQTSRPVLITANVEEGKVVDVAEVHFVGTVKAALNMSQVGGLVSIERCLFTEQAEHSGLPGEVSMILYVASGQTGKKGYVRFNHNRAIGTVAPRQAGSNPGGLFMSPHLVEDTLVGNMTTLEATGNYFWGYGQNLAGNGISPIHIYRSMMGVRITDNYFEECSSSAISAKSVTDFVCANNIFVGGATSANNSADEGVISYVPGYNSGAVVQPRAVISGNIIEKPGGETSALVQNGISVHGTATSRANDVIVTDNVINGAGIGIHTLYTDNIIVTDNIISAGSGIGISARFVNDIKISGNTVHNGAGATAGSQSGVALSDISGDVLVSENIVKTTNGHGITAASSMSKARVTIRGNKLEHSSVGYYAALLRGMAYLKLSGNEFHAVAGYALDIRSDSAGNKVGYLGYDASNSVVSGRISYVWTDILQATGQLRAPNSPLGAVTPGEVGTTYQQDNGTGDSIAWLACGTTMSSWVKAYNPPTSGPSAANRLLGMTFDPASATVGQAATAAGALSLGKVQLLGGGAISKVLFQIAKGGTGLVAGQCYVGVYGPTGALLGKSADMASTFAAIGNKTVVLTAPTAPQLPGSEVFVALLWNGTSGPLLRGINGAGMANIGIPLVADYRFTTAGSGLKALPDSRPTSTSSSSAPWLGVG